MFAYRIALIQHPRSFAALSALGNRKKQHALVVESWLHLGAKHPTMMFTGHRTGSTVARAF